MPRFLPTLAVPLLALLVSVVRADIRTYTQLWQIGGYSLADLDELQFPLSEMSTPAQARRNPALISGAEGWGISLAHQFQTGEARNTTIRAMPRADPWLPAEAALRGWAGPVALSVAWEQRYNSHEQALVTTAADTVGTWQDWNARVERWNFQAAWQALAPCCNRPGLRLGAGISRNSLRVDQVEVQRFLGVWGWQVGARTELKRASLALGWESRVFYNHAAPVHFNRYSSRVDTVQVLGRLPQTLHMQMGYLPWAGWNLDLALRYYFWGEQILGYTWNEATQLYQKERLRDRMEFSLIAHHGLPGSLNWHAGLCSSGSDPIRHSWLEGQFGSDKNTLFLLGGVSVSVGPAQLDLKVADSHLGPGAYRKQTIIQAGLSVSLPPK